MAVDAGFENKFKIIRLWHSEVHRRFNEHLYYYLCVVRPYDADAFREKLNSLFGKNNIRGFCYYEVYGAYDILIRVWLPAAKEANFSDQIRQNIQEIRHIVPFRVGAFHRYWAQGEKDFSPSALRLVSAKNIKKVQDGDDESLAEQFKTNQLLIDFPNEDDNIKFFMAISRPQVTDNAAELGIIQQISDLLISEESRAPEESEASSDLLISEESRAPEESEASIKRTSIYVGIGFAWLLLKGETKEFFNIGRLNSKLVRLLANHQSHTTTYVTIGPIVEQYFYIGETSLNAARGKILAVENIIPELYADETEISVQRTRDIETWVLDNIHVEEYVDEDLEKIKNVLIGVINESTEEVSVALFSVFTKVEAFLRRNWQEFVSNQLGKNAIKNIVQSVGIKKKESLIRLPLGDLVKIFGHIAGKCGKDIGLHEDYFSGWQDAVEMRNTVMHGDFELKAEWQGQVAFLPGFLKQFRNLKIIFQKNQGMS